MADLKEWVLNGPHTLSVGEYYLRRLSQHSGQKAAMVDCDTGSELTYEQLLRRSKAVSGLLRSLRVGAADTVMLCCGNTLEAPPIMLGTMFIAAALAPVNPAFGTSDMLHLLRTIQPQLVISNQVAEPCIREALAGHQPQVALITIDDVIACWADDSYVEGFHLGVVQDTDTHVALVLCSSGTTGKAKSVEMTHLRLLTLEFMNLFPEYERGSEIVILSRLIPFWGSYHRVVMYSLSAGYKLVQFQTFNVETFFSIVQQYKVNLFFVWNPELTAFAEYPSTERLDLSSLRDCVVWGCSLNHHVLATAVQNLRCPITNVYGMVECGGMLRPAYHVRNKPVNVGTLADNAKVKVVDLDSGKTVGPNCTGELRFLTKTCFKGYRGNPQATQDMFDDEGYLCTGDLGYYDDEGFFYIVDRIKELITYKWNSVCPSDIAEVIMRHPAVLEVAVVGIDDSVDRGLARAFVVLRPGASASEEEIAKLVQKSEPIYKWLHGGVRFIEELPRTVTGKVQTYKLRKL